MHRLILGLTDPAVHTDHINGDGLDNHRANLRVCSHAENMRNSRKRVNNKSGFKGVSWNKAKGKWKVPTSRRTERTTTWAASTTPLRPMPPTVVLPTNCTATSKTTGVEA